MVEKDSKYVQPVLFFKTEDGKEEVDDATSFVVTIGTHEYKAELKTEHEPIPMTQLYSLF